ncbi:hypothetical protein JCM5296_000765 [Sporobolomyces johnsonii]
MAPLVAYHKSTLPPSGSSHALACLLSPSLDLPLPQGHRFLSHLITARHSVLHLWAVVEFINDRNQPTASLHHLRTRRVLGNITSLSRVRTLASKADGCDRVLVSFSDAKMSLMEWSQDDHDLLPVSLHTFEKLPQVADDRPTLLATDPSSRMTVLLLPTNSGGDGTLAILPFFSEELDLEGLGMDREGWDRVGGEGSIPYAPSHLLPLSSTTAPTPSASALSAARSSTLPSSTSSHTNAFLPGQSTPPIRNVIDMCFLPGFTEPTLALLYAPDWTWSGRLEHLAHNYLVSLVTLSSRSTSTSTSTPTTPAGQSPTLAVVISTSPPLPYSLLALSPVPAAVSTGSVLLHSANGLLLLDCQGGKLVGVASTAWLGRDFPPGRALASGVEREPSASAHHKTVDEKLEGCIVEFLRGAGDDDDDRDEQGAADGTALVWCKSGAVLKLTVERTGRAVSGLKLERVAVGMGGASCIARIPSKKAAGAGYVFVGRETGEEVLLRWEAGGAALRGTETAEREGATQDTEMDFEDEEDIYGDSASSSKPATATAVSTRSTTAGKDGKLRLEVCDTVAGYGAVRSLVMGLVDDESPAELVAATGAGKTAGLTVFHRTLPFRSRRPLALPLSASSSAESTQEEGQLERGNVPDLTATNGIWVLKVGAGGQEVWAASGREGIMFYRPGPRSSFQLIREEEGTAVFAGTMARGTIILLVGLESIKLYDSDLNPLQSLPLSPPLPPTSSPRCSLTSTSLAVHTGPKNSEQPRLFVLDESTRALRELEGAAKEGSRIAVWRDQRGELPLARPRARASTSPHDLGTAGGAAGREDHAMDEDDDGLYGASMAAAPQSVEPGQGKPEVESEEERIVKPDGEGWEWVAEVDREGTLTIRLLPDLTEVYRSSAITLLPSVLLDGASRSIPASIDPDDLTLERISLVELGPSNARKLHLVVLLANGSMAVYEAFPSLSSVPSLSPADSAQPPPPRLALRFVKTLVRHIPLAVPRRKGAGAQSSSDLPPPRRELVPFANVSGHTGAFWTGEEAFWLVKGAHGPARCVESAERGVYAFIGLDRGECAVQTREGLSLATLPPALTFDAPMPYTHVPKDRTYAYLTFDLESGLYVAGTLNETRFVAFDEDGQVVWKEAGTPGLVDPYNYQSTLELLVPGTWEAIDGYEFRQNEFVSTVKSVSLASKSTAAGVRDFIAVGTTVYRGEDLAARGGIYIFEVVPINAHPATPRLDHQLKLRFFEDTKSVVGNICDLNGYLFLSMGQKLYARAFEQDEVLLAVGFLDVGVHVTSLQAMKNFLLIGDAMQSVALVAFQEDPYKLVFLGRDYRPSRVSNANFLVNDGKVAFVTGDDKGVLRLFEYDPTNIASHAGQRLLCRTEYHAGSESIATMLFAKRMANEDPKQNGILYGGIDGSLYTLVPVRDAVFRRLQSLQTTMSRHVLHFGGLNPRGYRIVKNDTVSRAITKGILDGDLLAEFENLALDRQSELAEHVGTDVDTVLANLRNLRGFE